MSNLPQEGGGGQAWPFMFFPSWDGIQKLNLGKQTAHHVFITIFQYHQCYESRMEAFIQKSALWHGDNTEHGKKQHKKFCRLADQYEKATRQTESLLLNYVEISNDFAELLLEDYEIPCYKDKFGVFVPKLWEEMFKRAEKKTQSKFALKNVSQRKKLARLLAQKHVKLQHCLVCGAMPSRLLHRHHWSYEEPVDVFQLCIKHHFLLHKEMWSSGTAYNKEATSKWIMEKSILKPTIQSSAVQSANLEWN